MTSISTKSSLDGLFAYFSVGYFFIAGFENFKELKLYVSLVNEAILTYFISGELNHRPFCGTCFKSVLLCIVSNLKLVSKQ